MFDPRLASVTVDRVVAAVDSFVKAFQPVVDAWAKLVRAIVEVLDKVFHAPPVSLGNRRRKAIRQLRRALSIA